MKNIMHLIAFTVLLLVGIWRLNYIIEFLFWGLKILRPFIIGSCIAFVICIPMKQIEKWITRKGKVKNRLIKKTSRTLSILLSFIFVFGLISFVLLIIIPEVGNTLVKLGDSIPGFITNVKEWVIDTIHKYPKIENYLNDYNIDWDKMSNGLLNFTTNVSNGLINSASSIISGVISAVTNFFIGIVFAVYILANKEKLACQGKKIIFSYLPAKRGERLLRILQLIGKTFAQYVSGQCTEACILGMIFFVVLSILGFPYASLIGVLVAFMALIPILGTYIGGTISTFLIFMVSPIKAFWFIIVFIITQQLEGNLIYPHVVGNSVGLSPMWVLFAVIVGGSVMGIGGMIICIPLFSVFYTLLRENVSIRLTVRQIPKEKWETK